MFYDRPDFPAAKVYIIGKKPSKYVLNKAIHHGKYPRNVAAMGFVPLVIVCMIASVPLLLIVGTVMSITSGTPLDYLWWAFLMSIAAAMWVSVWSEVNRSILTFTGNVPRSLFGSYGVIRTYFARDIRTDSECMFVSWFDSDMSLLNTKLNNPTPRYMQLLVEELNEVNLRKSVLGALRDHTDYGRDIKPTIDSYFMRAIYHMDTVRDENPDDRLRQLAQEAIGICGLKLYTDHLDLPAP